MFRPHALVDVTRAMQPESWHSGTVVIARADGSLLGVVGDARRVVFPRSVVKIIQALPLIESGAAAHFRLSNAELALVCASHSGAASHVAMVDGLLQRIGLGSAALACGGHLPIGLDAQRALMSAGLPVTALHNNCSGKHCGMLATAVHLGEPVEDYELAHHRVQQRVRAAMGDVIETDLTDVLPGIDGCSVPNWPVPLDRIAVAFARIVSGCGFSETRNKALRRLVEACWAAPEAMAGAGRFDTEVLRRFGGEVFVKGGAEGVYCGGIRSLGVGFALKIDDGAGRASEMAAGAIVGRLVEAARDLGEPRILENAAGIAVGEIKAGSALTSVLSRLQI